MIKIMCAAVIMVNLTVEPWNKQDMAAVERAKMTCLETYKGCLKKITKVETNTFHAICGPAASTAVFKD